MIADKAFFTDGELNFPRSSVNIKNAYWSPGDNADTILVNGKVWSAVTFASLHPPRS